MGSTKRQRQKEGRAARLEAAYAEHRRARNRRRILTFVVVVAVFLGGAFVLSLVLDDDDSGEVATGDTSTTAGDTSSDTSTPSEQAVLEPVPDGAAVTGETPCPPADGSAERTSTFENPPPMCIDTAKTYTAEVTTSKGAFTVELLDDKAPTTVNSFVVLSRYHYYDGVAFHRIIPGFVVQGGDPTTTGSGGPGYTFEDELPEQGEYEIGSVAMANSGPDTNGSQFFVISGDRGVALPPSYSLFGKVTEGMDVVLAIEAVGSAEGTPAEAVTIESVTITEQ
jgi:cyclophilin family peptidyl-prolyl cis-trans isomerase